VESYSDYYYQRSFRRSLFQSAVLANLGWEYRTEKAGYFYLGASYQRPFTYIYVSEIRYQPDGKNDKVAMTVPGNYFTVDLRYFFHEDPRKKKPSRDEGDE